MHAGDAFAYSYAPQCHEATPAAAEISRPNTVAPSFGTHVKIGTKQRRLAWPLCKDDIQHRRTDFATQSSPASTASQKKYLLQESQKRLRRQREMSLRQ
eukprot:317967-Pelagomonas_calceolata.AAC.1